LEESSKNKDLVDEVTYLEAKKINDDKINEANQGKVRQMIAATTTADEK
jgi:hypothetical protein